MAKMNGPLHFVLCLLVVGLCWGRGINRFIHSVGFGSWEEARQQCLDRELELVGVDNGINYMSRWLNDRNYTDPVWVGLRRDTESDKAWRWIDFRTGELITRFDPSDNRYWSPGDQDPHCAMVGEDGKSWYSQLCSTPHPFYCSLQNNITFMETESTWDEAEKVCQGHSMSLATVYSENSPQFNRSGWIGLRREGGDTWVWSDGSSLGYTNWAEGEPRTRDCGSFNGTSKQWNSNECSQTLRTLCQLDNLRVVKLNKTWEEAVSYCRELSMYCTGDSCRPDYDLATPHRIKDAHFIGDKMCREGTTDEVWVGLRFLSGEWFGLSGRPIGGWVTLPDCPSQQRCATIAKYNDNEVMLRDCTERKNFICAR